MRTNTLLGLAAALAVLYILALVVAGQELQAAGVAAPAAVATPAPQLPRLPYDPPRPWYPEPVPTAAPTPAPPWWLPTLPTPTPALPLAPATVTWQDDGRAYSMPVHQQFYLDLGSPPTYASSSNPAVLRPLPYPRPLAQGGVAGQIFEAVAPGWATVTATSGFRCPPGAMCVQPAIAQRVFHVTIRVIS